MGHALFARYAYPPNELGYCGPPDADALLRSQSTGEIEVLARGFDGTWPYLRAIADAAGIADPLHADVVTSYWIGGDPLASVEPRALLGALRSAFTGQVTGLLTELDDATNALAHHSFHVFVVYPWVRFLGRDAGNALRILQNCRIRWGTVESVEGDYALVRSRPLVLAGDTLALASPVVEAIRWRRKDLSLTAVPRSGCTVAAHWDWVCDVLDDAGTAALAQATYTTLDVVNASRKLLLAG